MTISCLYDGTVAHARHVPREHRFDYGVFMVYLDLDELPGLFDGIPLWSARRPAPGWFRRADYLGDPQTDLADEVRSVVAARLGLSADERPRGPVRMLTNLRMWGYAFNPVTFYWCFDEAGETVTHTVAEVTNTPWGERHAYVADSLVSSHEKALHVSPFLSMDMRYTLRLGRPEASLAVSISAEREGRRAFDAALKLERRELTSAALLRRLLTRPPMTAKVSGAIYAQALRLRAKGIRPHARPKAAT